MREIETYIVDSFTDTPFKGNPAGVCILQEPLSVDNMLSIAIELGLSETAFVHKAIDQDIYSIRYFSPKMEIPLCGHATLAASKVLFNRHPQVTQIHYVTIQELDLIINGIGDKIIMEFPVYKTIPCSVPPPLLQALGIDKIIKSVFNVETQILLLEIDSCQVLAGLKPDFAQLIKSHDSINGVLVTAPSVKSNYDFESRYFWPWSGTNEDPVTGGTHTFLAKHWGDKWGKKKMNSFQCSERTGFMEVELVNDEIVKIKSQAQIILRGHLQI